MARVFCRATTHKTDCLGRIGLLPGTGLLATRPSGAPEMGRGRPGWVAFTAPDEYIEVPERDF